VRQWKITSVACALENSGCGTRVFSEVTEVQRTYLWGNWSPSRLIVVTFAVVIAVGTCLLLLPWASAGEPLSVLEALFTATSATCVTGLVVVDTGTDLSTMGQLVVLALIQIGGLGLMTFSTLALVLLGKRLRLHDRMVVKTVVYREGASDLGAVVRAVIGMTLAFEALWQSSSTRSDTT